MKISTSNYVSFTDLDLDMSHDTMSSSRCQKNSLSLGGSSCVTERYPRYFISVFGESVQFCSDI